MADADVNADLVSVLVPAFNAASTIVPTIRSALAQRAVSLELIVADDGSTDRTASIVSEAAAADHRVRLVRTPGRTGPAGARNAAAAVARGRWLALLDSDDVWHADKLARQLDCAARSGAAIVYSGYWRVSEDGRWCGAPVRVPTALGYPGALGNSAIATSTAFVDRSLVGTPRFDPSVGYDDFELWTRLLAGGATAVGIDEPLMAYRVRLGSVSRRRVRMSSEVWKVLRTHRGLAAPEACARFAAYALRAAIKHRTGRPRLPSEKMLPPEILCYLQP
jgi:teichuronic acid biosynthesis glycosyltransferase TuaG